MREVGSNPKLPQKNEKQHNYYYYYFRHNSFNNCWWKYWCSVLQKLAPRIYCPPDQRILQRCSLIWRLAPRRRGYHSASAATWSLKSRTTEGREKTVVVGRTAIKLPKKREKNGRKPGRTPISGGFSPA